MEQLLELLKNQESALQFIKKGSGADFPKLETLFKRLVLFIGYLYSKNSKQLEKSEVTDNIKVGNIKEKPRT